MKSLCVIPARGGSKRLPRKNVRPFCGKPMIAWSIEAAIESKSFDRIIVSTDDPEIAAVAVAAGAEVPFLRPPEYSDDHTTILEVVRHAILEIHKSNPVYELVCCLFATAPLVRPEDINRGLELLRTSPEILYAFSATSFPFPIQRAIKLAPDNGVSMFQPEHMLTRSQDLPEAFHEAGQFNWGRASAFVDRTRVYLPHSRIVKIPRYLVQDIDTEEDWIRLEAMFKAIKHSS